jgi:hypothetical protein
MSDERSRQSVTAAVARRRALNLADPSRVSGPPQAGARLPCTRTGCKGVMQYNGEPISTGPALLDPAMATIQRGWVCSSREQHSHPGQGPAARGWWEDDGGTQS